MDVVLDTAFMIICYGSNRKLACFLAIGQFAPISAGYCTSFHVPPHPTAHIEAGDHGYFLLAMQTILTFLEDIEGSASIGRKSVQESTKEKKHLYVSEDTAPQPT